MQSHELCRGRIQSLGQIDSATGRESRTIVGMDTFWLHMVGIAYLVSYMLFWSRMLLNSSIHLCSGSPLGTTTKLRYPSRTSNPSDLPSFVDLAVSHTFRSVIFIPTFSKRFKWVIAYTVSLPITYSCLESQSGGGAFGGNMVSRRSPNLVSSWKLGTTSDWAYWG